jgi:subtilisin family serine protease
VSVAAPGELGTSFAAPVVAAAAAQVWAASPKLRAREVVSVLEATASLRGTRTDKLGFGVIDVAAAVARARALR